MDTEIKENTKSLNYMQVLGPVKRIYKYTPVGDGYSLPVGFNIIHTGVQRNIFCIWAEVNIYETKTNSFTVESVGTGFDAPWNGVYLTTTVDNSCRHFDEVWHYYLVPKE